MGTRARSITRAAKRGHFINWQGEYSHEKPFNNRANTSKRKGVNSRRESAVAKQMWFDIKHPKTKEENE